MTERDKQLLKLFGEWLSTMMQGEIRNMSTIDGFIESHSLNRRQIKLIQSVKITVIVKGTRQ